jgi:hypothetical protein
LTDQHGFAVVGALSVTLLVKITLISAYFMRHALKRSCMKLFSGTLRVKMMWLRHLVCSRYSLLVDA